MDFVNSWSFIGAGIMLVCLLALPIVLLIILFISLFLILNRSAGPQLVNCQYCAEPIRAEATVCEHCGRSQAVLKKNG